MAEAPPHGESQPSGAPPAGTRRPSFLNPLYAGGAGAGVGAGGGQEEALGFGDALDLLHAESDDENATDSQATDSASQSLLSSRQHSGTSEAARWASGSDGDAAEAASQADVASVDAADERATYLFGTPVIGAARDARCDAALAEAALAEEEAKAALEGASLDAGATSGAAASLWRVREHRAAIESHAAELNAAEQERARWRASERRLLGDARRARADADARMAEMDAQLRELMLEHGSELDAAREALTKAAASQRASDAAWERERKGCARAVEDALTALDAECAARESAELRAEEAERRERKAIDKLAVVSAALDAAQRQADWLRAEVTSAQGTAQESAAQAVAAARREVDELRTQLGLAQGGKAQAVAAAQRDADELDDLRAQLRAAQDAAEGTRASVVAADARAVAARHEVAAANSAVATAQRETEGLRAALAAAREAPASEAVTPSSSSQQGAAASEAAMAKQLSELESIARTRQRYEAELREAEARSAGGGVEDLQLHEALILSLREQVGAWRTREEEARAALRAASADAADYRLLAPAVEAIRREEYEEERRARRSADERAVGLESQLYAARVEVSHLRERLVAAGLGVMADDARTHQQRALTQGAI